MRKLFSITIFAVLFLSISSFALGQGNMRGVITDSSTAKPLVGANVYLLGTALGSATDLEGVYRIQRIPPGRYTLRISYIGYMTKNIDVFIESDKTAELDVALIYDVIEGKMIVVTAQAEGQVAAINQQITAPTIINVISEEKIQELPDANAAESIGRLPGVALQRSGGEANKTVLRGLSDKFSTITINGIRMAPTDSTARGVDLSTISQGSLAGVELYKALTSDMDGDAIAGSINLVTKKAPTERLLRFESRGSYNQLNSAYDQYDFTLRYGERFFKNMLGIQLSGNLEKRDRSNEEVDLDNNLNVTYQDMPIWQLDGLNLTYTDEERDRKGFSVLFDLDSPDGGSIRFNNIYNMTKRDFTTYYRNYVAPWGDDQIFYNIRVREQEIQTFVSSMTGKNYLFGLSTDWGLSYANSKSKFPFDYEMNFLEAGGMRNIPDSLWNGPPEAFIPYANNNFDESTLYTAYYRGQDNNDVEKNIFLNLEKEYSIRKLFSGRLKIGGKNRTKSRDRSVIEQYSPYYNRPYARWDYSSGVITRKDLSGTRFEDLVLGANSLVLLSNLLDMEPKNRKIYDKYNLYPLINPDAIREWWELNRDGLQDSSYNTPEYYSNPEAEGMYYDITERVSSAFIMNSFNYKDRITFIAGLRVEHENNDYDAKYSPTALGGYPIPPSAYRDTSAVHKETILLPNFHFTIRPLNFLNVRLAAYKALARPDFNYRLPNEVLKARSTFFPGNNWYLGNADLKAMKAWNYEINTSIFSNKVGLFSVSVFYKELEDNILYMDGLPVTSGEQLREFGIDVESPYGDRSFVFWYPYNSNKPAWVKGIEIEHQANLSFLPGLWKNIVLGYNMSIIRSQTYIVFDDWYTVPSPIPGFPATVVHRPGERKAKLEGQPEFFGNFAIGYDIGGFSARLSVFHQGEYNRSYGTLPRDNIVNAFTRWDLAVKYKIFKNIDIMLNINNITNLEESTSIRDNTYGWRLLNDSERYGTTADLGIRFNF
jgi:TonB-dependent receptor